MAEKNPYTFDAQNPRWVVDVKPMNKVYAAAGILFLYSLSAYNRKYFRVDNNLVNFMFFTACSAPASYAYANFWYNNAQNEAAAINNHRESSSWK